MKPAHLILQTSHHCFKVLLFHWSLLKASSRFFKSNQQMLGNHYMLAISFCTVKSPSEAMADENCGYLLDHVEEPFRAELVKSLNLLSASGVNKKDITKHQGILRTHSLYTNISNLLKLRKNPTAILPLLSLPPATLRRAVKQFQSDKEMLEGLKDRMSYLQHHLELNDDEFVNLALKHPSLLTLPFSKLDKRMQVLKSAKISAKDIVKDAKIFNYKHSTLMIRIEAALSMGVPIKPWHLHCQKEHFDLWLSQMQETQDILQGEDQFSYLAKRLNCSKEYAKQMLRNNLFLQSINICKVEKIIDFLLEKGYTPEEIRLYPQVFRRSLTMLEKRFAGFKRIENEIPSLFQLCSREKL